MTFPAKLNQIWSFNYSTLQCELILLFSVCINVIMMLFRCPGLIICNFIDKRLVLIALSRSRNKTKKNFRTIHIIHTIHSRCNIRTIYFKEPSNWISWFSLPIWCDWNPVNIQYKSLKIITIVHLCVILSAVYERLCLIRLIHITIMLWSIQPLCWIRS